MARIRDDIPMIEVTSRKVIVRPSVGRMWLDFHIEHGGLALAEMTNIKLVLVHPQKTVTIQEYADGVELNELNKRYKRHTEAGVLSFYHALPEIEDEIQRLSGALGTGGLTNLYVEFTKPANQVVDVTAWGRKTRNRSVAAGIINYVTGTNKGGNASGENHLDSIDKRDRIRCIHVINPHVTELELKVDTATAYKLDRSRAGFDEQVNGRRTPYATDYGMAIDFTLSGVLDESLVMRGDKGYQVQEMRLTTSLDNGVDPVSGEIRYLVEYQSNWASLVGASAQQAA